MEHHPFGGSVLWRRRECSGSYNAEKDLPEIISEASKSGDRVHLASRLMLDQYKRGEEVGLGLGDMDDIPGLVGMTDDEAAWADDCFGYFVHIWEPYQKKYSLDRNCIYIEEKVQLNTVVDDPTSPLLTFGTCDVYFLVRPENLGVVLDWKSGPKEFSQDAVGWQVMNYGQSIMETYQLANARCLIRNPRTHQSYECAFGVTDGARKMIEATIKVGMESTKVTAGDHCDYCRALGLCEATVEKARDLVETIGVVAQKTDRATKKAVEDQLSIMSPELLLPLLNMAAIVRPAYEAVISRAKEVLRQDPDALPGWKLSRRGGARKAPFADSFHAVSKILTEDQFWACCSVSVSKLERAFAEVYAGEDEDGKPLPKKFAKDAFKGCMGDLISQVKVEELRRVKNKDG